MPIPDPNSREITCSIERLSLYTLKPFCVPTAKYVWSWLKLMYRIYSRSFSIKLYTLSNNRQPPGYNYKMYYYQ